MPGDECYCFVIVDAVYRTQVLRGSGEVLGRVASEIFEHACRPGLCEGLRKVKYTNATSHHCDRDRVIP